MSRRTREIAQVYTRSAPAYRRNWAPALVHLAGPLLERLPDVSRGVLVDAACGLGTISERIPARTIIGADLSPGMLAHVPDPIRPVIGDIRRSPVRSGVADLAVCTFALQHIPQPGVAIGDMLRTVRPGGSIGLVTWGADSDEAGPAYDVIEAVLRRARAPKDPIPKGFHARVDHPRKVARFARAHGARDIEVWTERVPYVWTRARFLQRAMTMGESGRRLAALPEARRTTTIREMRERLAELGREAFVWRPEIVYLIAVRA
jgi:SAM-dependent methyltransferase